MTASPFRRTPVLVSLAVALTACSDAASPTGPTHDTELASPAEVEAYLPVIEDATARVLPPAADPTAVQRLGLLLERLETALDRRNPEDAARSLLDAQAELDACGTDCLIPPERSVIQLALDYARMLLDLEFAD